MLKKLRYPRLFALVSTTILMLFLSACAQHSGERFVLITANKQVPYWQAARAGLDDAAGAMKIQVAFDGPDAYEPKGEVEAIRAAVKSKVSGIIISAADPVLMKPEIDAAIQAGIPVITIDSDAPGSKRLLFVGTNNYQAGLLGGEAAAKAMNGKGAVVVFTMPNQANLEERLQGYRATFSKYPGIKIDRVVDIKGDPRIAFDTTQSIVDHKEKIDGFICLEALAGKEVASVLTQNHVTDKKIVAMDTDSDTLDFVAKGAIAATVAQKPYTMGYFGLQLADMLHHHPSAQHSQDWGADPRSPLPAFVDTGVTLVDKNNVSAFQKK